MLFYRALRATRNAYPFVALGTYIAAFVLAAALMFVFPPGTILLLWIGLFSLAPVVLGWHLIRYAARVTARSALARAVCPVCGTGHGVTRDPAMPWRCGGCNAIFLAGGEETDDATLAASGG